LKLENGKSKLASADADSEIPHFAAGDRSSERFFGAESAPQNDTLWKQLLRVAGRLAGPRFQEHNVPR